MDEHDWLVQQLAANRTQLRVGAWTCCACARTARETVGVHLPHPIMSYDVTNVNLFMPGLWEIRTTIGGARATSDHVAPQFDIR